MNDGEPQPWLLGPYLMLLPIARGGMGEVWIAAPMESPDPSRLCLVKCIKSDLDADAETRSRFVDEANIALALRGAHLCHVFEAGAGAGKHFLAMELIEGVTFKRLIDNTAKEPLSPAEAVALVVGLLRGLHEAHTARAADGQPLGVVHRDVSPHNAMVDVRGLVKVIDFGLATSSLKQTMTEPAVVLGKMAYMAPEQARGETPFAAADQFAAAVVLYELLTGDRFYGDLPSRAVWGIVGSGQHRPRSWHFVPAGLAPILARALAAQPEARFPGCDVFAATLVHALPQAVVPETMVRLGQRVGVVAEREIALVQRARELLVRLRPDFDGTVAEATHSMTLRLRGDRPASAPSRLPSAVAGSSSFAHAPAPGAELAAPRRRAPLVAGAAALVIAFAGIGIFALRAPPPTSPPASSTSASTPTTTTTAATTTAATTTAATTTAATTTAATTTAATTTPTTTTTTAPTTTTTTTATPTPTPATTPATSTKPATTPTKKKSAPAGGNDAASGSAAAIERALRGLDDGCPCKAIHLSTLAKATQTGTPEALETWAKRASACVDKCAPQ